jgi:hypothetical protein
VAGKVRRTIMVGEYEEDATNVHIATLRLVVTSAWEAQTMEQEQTAYVRVCVW